MLPDDRAAPSADPPVTLVVGTDDWAIEQAASGLAAAGLEVMRCQQAGGSAFPCFGVTTHGGCPLDRGADVVLAVRHRSAAEPAPHEMGVVCALHRGVPVVVAGMVTGAPYAPFATAVVEQHEDPATACRGAAAPAIRGESTESQADRDGAGNAVRQSAAEKVAQ